MNWHFDSQRLGGNWRWRLFNRHGEVVMISRESYPTQASANAAARHECHCIRESLAGSGERE